MLEAHANKVVTQDHVAFQTEIKTMEQRVSTSEGIVAGGIGVSGSASAPEKNTIPQTFEGELDQWRAWRDDFVDFSNTCNVKTLKFLQAIAMNRDTLVESTKNRDVGCSGRPRASVAGAEGDFRVELQGLSCCRSHVDDGFEVGRQVHKSFHGKLMQSVLCFGNQLACAAVDFFNDSQFSRCVRSVERQ